MKQYLNVLTKARKLSRKQCMNLKNNQFVRMNGSGYFRVLTVNKLDKTVDVFHADGTGTYDFSDVMYDKACELFDSLYKTSKKFRSVKGSGILESSFSSFLDTMSDYSNEPEKAILKVIN